MADQRDRPADEERDGEDDQARRKQPSTTPAEEWGERLDHGKTVARGGKTEGRVPGAHKEQGS